MKHKEYIRGLSDSELAEYLLYGKFESSFGYYCANKCNRFDGYDCTVNANCTKACEDWLNEEVSERG